MCHLPEANRYPPNTHTQHNQPILCIFHFPSFFFFSTTDPEKEFPEALPRRVSARSSACTEVAETIKGLGYRGDLGYHQILYPNEGDTRQVLLFLSKNLPETMGEGSMGGDAGRGEGSQATTRDVMNQRLAVELGTAVRAAWKGPLQRPAWHVRAAPLRLGVYNKRAAAAAGLPGLEAYYRDYLAPAAAQPRAPNDLAASVFEGVALAGVAARDREAERQGTLDSGLTAEQYRERRRGGVQSQVAQAFRAASAAAAAAAAAASSSSSSNGDRKQAGLAELLQNYGQGNGSRGGRFARQVKYQTEETAPATETAEERVRKLEEELEARGAELAGVQAEVGAVQAALAGFDDKERQLEAECRAEDARFATLGREYRVKKNTYDLLPTAEQSIRELRELADSQAQRIMDLAGEWEKHRAPLVDEIRRLQDLQNAALGESRQKLEEVKRIRAEIKQLIDEIRQKEDRYKQLVEAYRALPANQSRTTYTRRILDIEKSVKKQKVDIAKILGDTRALQKEINSIRDTLGRSFTVADELIYQDARREAAKGAKQDTVKKDIYKQLLAINEEFENLVRTIEETGQMRTDILSLESKIDHLQTRSSSFNMERVEDDLRQVREANDALVAKIKSLEKKKKSKL